MEQGRQLTSQENELSSDEQGRSKLKKELLFVNMFATNLFACMSFGLIGPLFPAEAKAKGVSYTIQGWIFGIYALAAIINSLVIGKIMPYIGVRYTYIVGVLFVR